MAYGPRIRRLRRFLPRTPRSRVARVVENSGTRSARRFLGLSTQPTRVARAVGNGRTRPRLGRARALPSTSYDYLVAVECQLDGFRAANPQGSSLELLSDPPRAAFPARFRCRAEQSDQPKLGQDSNEPHAMHATSTTTTRRRARRGRGAAASPSTRTFALLVHAAAALAPRSPPVSRRTTLKGVAG